MIDKLKDCFDEMVIYKDLRKSNTFSALSLPSFLRDWLLKMFEDENGNYDVDEVITFVKQYLPRKEEWTSIKARIVQSGERVKILTRISINIDIKKQEVTFRLPEFGLESKDTIIERDVWHECKDDLITGNEVWGIIELGYRWPDDTVKPKIDGKIKLLGFQNFRPYNIDLEYFKDMRAEFTTKEWIDVILGAIDYNADGYNDEHSKLCMLKRLLPFVEKRLNLMELAPKGTGKSYLFGSISKYGMLVDGGKVTRAKMFYDDARKQPGYIFGNDFVAIDEVKLAKFGDVGEMRSVLQGYMEKGSFNFQGFNGISDAGIIFLGNIAEDNWNEYRNMMGELPELFQESALIDRIHGFIKGWDIPRMDENLKISGWALNSEYFCSILHLLREDISYRAIVDELLLLPEHADTRDTEAVKRIATAYLKLLFPNVRKVEDINIKEFNQYCLRPAKKMREIIIQQLGILDTEYRGKTVPKFVLKDNKYEM